jgi:uncharacterized protein (DUF1015 family)
VASGRSAYHDPCVPELVPFRALRYNAARVPDVSAVLCPPYDVISDVERRRLALLDARNAVHVELPESYDAARNTFAKWLEEGTLVRDDRPFIYVYEQRYRTADGREESCRGFYCRLRLEPYGDSSGVRPHEHTLSAAKEDRFRLMQAVDANLSPVLFLYDTGVQADRAAGLMSELMSHPPAIDSSGPGGIPNTLWLADPAESAAARELLSLAAQNPVTIADGHHRYETALRYCDQVGGDDASGYVLALMFEAKSGGLELRPWHRVLRGVGEMLARTTDWFVPTSAATLDELTHALEASTADGTVVFGLWTAEGGRLLVADRERVGSLLPASASEKVRSLDVSVLSATLSRMIGESSEELAAEGRLSYFNEIGPAVDEVEARRADAAFLVRATPVADVLAVAAAGEFMPAKSTLFYPKAATGLVFNPMCD